MSQPQGPIDYLSAIAARVERIDERIRDVATRSDVDALRKEMVARDLLESQLSSLRSQIVRLEQDRLMDKKAADEQIEKLENEQTSRSERLWTRLGPVIAALALLLSLFEFLTHLQIR